MGATYTRQSSFTDGDVITADLFNNEYDQLLAAFAASTGHTHDGTAAEGGPITKLLGTSITIGDATSGTDITVTFDGETNDGVFKWMEDEDYFEFSDDLLIASTEKIQFRDTAIYINSSTDGQLDIVADSEIQIAATTIDINGNVDISGTLTIGGAGISEAELEILDGATVTTTEINILDGDTTASSTTVADADRVVFNDAGTMKQVAVTDLAAYFDDEITAMPNLVTTAATTVGALNSGSITSGFGTIDTGSSTITTTGLISGGSLDIDDVLINGTTIGHTDDTDLITLANGVVTVAGEVSMTTLDIGGTNVTSTAAELNIVDGDTSATSTTVADADRVVMNDNGTMVQVAVTDLAAYFDDEITAMPNLVSTGALNSGSITSGFGTIDTGSSNITTTGVGAFGSLDISGDIDVDGTTNLDVVDIDGAVDMASTLAVTGIATFTDDIIIGDGKTIGSASDVDAITIASNGQVTLTQTLIGTALDISGDIDVDGTTNLDVVDIDGAVDMASTALVTGVLTANGGAVFNENSADVDFRVESNGNANMLFVDGGNDAVGIGTSSPAQELDVNGQVRGVDRYYFKRASDNYSLSALARWNGSTGSPLTGTAGVHTVVGSEEASSSVIFAPSNTERMRIDSSGAVGIKTTTPATNGQFSVRGAIATTSYGNVSGDFSDASTGSLKISHASGVVKLITDQTLSFLTGTSVVAMGIDATGAVTKPLQPAFLARPASQQDNFATNTTVTVAFGTEVFDQNADFASNTFTAPIAGKYQLNVLIYLLNADLDVGFYQPILATSNRSYSTVISTGSFDADVAYHTISQSVLADMDAGDTASVGIQTPSGGADQADVHTNSYFSGYLVA